MPKTIESDQDYLVLIIFYVRCALLCDVDVKLLKPSIHEKKSIEYGLTMEVFIRLSTHKFAKVNSSG